MKDNKVSTIDVVDLDMRYRKNQLAAKKLVVGGGGQFRESRQAAEALNALH